MVVEGELDNGRRYPVVLDTGASAGLFVTDIHIMENKLAICPVAANGDDSPGWRKHDILPILQVGDRTVKNAMISVLPDDSPLLDRCPGLIGMQFFRDTIVVLDFQRNLMWVNGTLRPTRR